MILLTNLSPPSEGVRHEQRETTAFLDGHGLGAGTLYIAETYVSWFDGCGRGFTVEYPSISLHAVSRELSIHPHEHIYLMVNSKLKDDSKKNCAAEDDEDDENDEDDSSDDGCSSGPVTEVRFVPSDGASLEAMFCAMSECHALHPGPDDSDSDFEGDEYDVEEAEQSQAHCSFEEGVSQLSLGCRSTMQCLAQELHKAGIWTNSSPTGLEGEAETGSTKPTEAGQFDADIDH